MNTYLSQIKQKLEPTVADIHHADHADASVLVAITDEPHPHVLLTRRASDMTSHAGEVAFPGGRHEPEDTNNLATALRETLEETNLNPKQATIIGQLEQQLSQSGLWVQPIVAIIPPNQSLIAEQKEIDRIFWIKLADFIEQPTQDYQLTKTMGNQSITLLTPSWQFDNEIIWGLTGRIIADLLKVSFDKKTPWYYRPIT